MTNVPSGISGCACILTASKVMTMHSADATFLVKDATNVPTVTVLVATVDPH